MINNTKAECGNPLNHSDSTFLMGSMVVEV